MCVMCVSGVCGCVWGEGMCVGVGVHVCVVCRGGCGCVWYRGRVCVRMGVVCGGRVHVWCVGGGCMWGGGGCVCR